MPAQKKCKACREPFAPMRPMQRVCSPACAIAELAAKKAKAVRVERTETAKALARLKTRAQLIKEAQAAFNAYIRARDAAKGCVSCDKPHTWRGQWHASHFYSTAARPDLRFDESNVHKSCSACNTYLSGNLIPYRAELIRRIGQAEVDRLEGPPAPTKLERHEIIALRAKYRQLTKERRAE